jgi:hypothetical protein
MAAKKGKGCHVNNFSQILEKDRLEEIEHSNYFEQCNTIYAHRVHAFNTNAGMV